MNYDWIYTAARARPSSRPPPFGHLYSSIAIAPKTAASAPPATDARPAPPSNTSVGFAVGAGAGAVALPEPEPEPVGRATGACADGRATGAYACVGSAVGRTTGAYACVGSAAGAVYSCVGAAAGAEYSCATGAVYCGVGSAACSGGGTSSVYSCATGRVYSGAPSAVCASAGADAYLRRVSAAAAGRARAAYVCVRVHAQSAASTSRKRECGSSVSSQCTSTRQPVRSAS